MKKLNYAIVGATGLVGRTFLKVLEERKLPINQITMFASSRSAGSEIFFNGESYTVVELTEQNILKCNADIALFGAGGAVSLKYAPIFAAKGTIVIDNSSCFRMDKDVPLIVPEVNPNDIDLMRKNIIANPNCSTIQAVAALAPLAKLYTLKRVVYTTFQAVSGAGINGVKDLEETAKGNKPTKFPYPIYNNIIPHIDSFVDNGYTKEEMKMIDETRKILNMPTLKITATTTRVPVTNCHSESINVEFEGAIDMNDIVKVFTNTDGLILYDDIKNNKYPLPTLANNKDEVFVGRVRRDYSVDNGINMWVVADNIRKGAATNAVQIAELLIKE